MAKRKPSKSAKRKPETRRLHIESGLVHTPDADRFVLYDSGQRINSFASREEAEQAMVEHSKQSKR